MLPVSSMQIHIYKYTSTSTQIHKYSLGQICRKTQHVLYHWKVDDTRTQKQFCRVFKTIDDLKNLKQKQKTWYGRATLSLIAPVNSTNLHLNSSLVSETGVWSREHNEERRRSWQSRIREVISYRALYLCPDYPPQVQCSAVPGRESAAEGILYPNPNTH